MKSKTSILLIITTLLTGNLSAQNYSLLVTPTFKPRTFNEMLIDAYIAAHARAVNQQKFQQYTAAAYEALASGDDEAFIQYSTYALRTGFYSAELYYDRGRVWEYHGYDKYAKKSYKSAWHAGHPEGYSAFLRVKEKIKNNRKKNKK